MAAFGEQAFMLLHVGKTLGRCFGMAGGNLVARTTDIVLDPSVRFTGIACVDQ